MKEQIVTGKKFRILTDVTSRLWHVISFWTKAQDVEFNDGTNAQSKLGNIVGISDSLTSTASNVAASAKAVKIINDKVVNQIGNLNGQIGNLNGQLNSALEGFNTIYNAIVGQGVTPDGKNPAQIVNGINAMANEKYNKGIADSKTEAKIFTQATVFGYSTPCKKGDIIAMATYGDGLAWDITNVTTLHHGVFAYSTMTIYRVNADGTVKYTFTQGSNYKWYLLRLHD